jgi:YfiH family protein
MKNMETDTGGRNQMSLGITYKNDRKIYREIEKDTPYLEFELLADTGVVRHGFSTRLGGVSSGCYDSLNLSFTRGDSEDAVRENFRRIASSIGVRCEDMVFSQQTHTTNVRAVTEADRGGGITRPLEYRDVDGLITNVPGLCLVTFYADCVPLYFVDPVKKVIGLSHSGWRGTVGKIGKITVEQMCTRYGCNPSDIRAAVGRRSAGTAMRSARTSLSNSGRILTEYTGKTYFIKNQMENINWICGRQMKSFLQKQESCRSIWQ